jgi:DNA-binding winged helix-turn-helix (wHTH) protein
MTYRFGRFLVDTNRRVLLSGDVVTPIGEKLFQILLLLLEADGDVVDKQKFFSHIWPSEETNESNLTQHIFLLRQTLGENARDHAFIVTVSGKGYRLAAPVERKMGLVMKGSCEACRAPLRLDAQAFICSYECTFCERCAQKTEYRCPNCNGELLARPRRVAV